MKTSLTVLTTTYRRSKCLKKCYESLKRQTNKSFEWLVIDDGSTDETEEVIKTIIAEEKNFSVRYYKKKNGGKHTALNFSHPYIRGEWVLMLDDDDVLTYDAVEIILKFCQKYEVVASIGCLSFQKGNLKDKNPLVDWESDEDIISNTIDFRINAKRFGDCAEIVRSDVFKKFPFPEFEGERFLAEDHLWINSAYEYETVYIRKVLYLAEYQENGLTKNVKRLRLKNPLGGMYSCNLYFNKKFNLSIRIRKAILYNVYAIASGQWFENFLHVKNKLLCVITFPAGLFFFLLWKYVN